MVIISILAFISGIIFGTQISWEWQLATIAILISFLNSPFVVGKEMEALLYYIPIIIFIIGIGIGDISWALQTGNFPNPFSLFIVK